MRHRIIPIASLLLPLALAACGSGGGTISAESARALTDARAPAETIADQLGRAASIFDRGDSLFMSTVHLSTIDADLLELELRSDCKQDTCSLREPRSGVTLRVSLDDLSFAPEATTDFGLTRRGITLFRTRATDVEAYGAWMEHVGFTVQTQSASTTIEGRKLDIGFRYGLAGGDLTGARPTGNATWQGLMVGTPGTGSRAGNVLQGDATLEYSLDDKMIDATFTGIKDLTRNAAHSTERVRFTNVPVGEKGTFGSGAPGNRIDGAFYGPNQAETAGVFAQSGIVGGFGAKRQ